MSPLRSSRGEPARERHALAYQMGIEGQSIDAIMAATGWSRNYVYTFLAEAEASYSGVRAKPGRPPVPRELADEYRSLVHDRGWTAKEAVRILGLT